jgi:hypothetical protein
MKSDNKSLIKKSLIIVAISYLLYNIYQTITTTIFVTHFPLVIARLPQFITSIQPSLQLGLFLFQESAGSAGSYLHLVAAIFAVYSAVLFLRNSSKYLEAFRKVVLFESLYFLLLLPAAANHLIGSIISTSALLNFYTGISVLLQALLIFPALFILYRKLKTPQDVASVLKWGAIAAPLYVFGFWIRHGFLWVYALSASAAPQAGFFEAAGFVDSWLTLLIAALVTSIACFVFWRRKKLNMRLVGTAIILFGAYFVVYDLVSVWQTNYRAFLPLTDFWIATLPILGIAILLKKVIYQLEPKINK